MAKRHAHEHAREHELPRDDGDPGSGEHAVAPVANDTDGVEHQPEPNPEELTVIEATNRDPAVIAARERNQRVVAELRAADAQLDAAERAFGEAAGGADAEERWLEVERARRRTDRARVAARMAEEALESVSAQAAARWHAQVSARYRAAIEELGDQRWMSLVEPMLAELVEMERRKLAIKASLSDILAQQDKFRGVVYNAYARLHPEHARKVYELDQGISNDLSKVRQVLWGKWSGPAGSRDDEHNLHAALRWMQEEVERRLKDQS